MRKPHPSALRRLSALLSSMALAVTGVIAAAPPAHATPTADGLMDVTIAQVNAPEDGLYAVGEPGDLQAGRHRQLHGARALGRR